MMALRCVSRSRASAPTLRQSTNDFDLAIEESRLRISAATSPPPLRLASSSLRRRLAAASPFANSSSNSDNRSAPRSARFLTLRVFPEAMGAFLATGVGAVKPRLDRVGLAAAVVRQATAYNPEPMMDIS